MVDLSNKSINTQDWLMPPYLISLVFWPLSLRVFRDVVLRDLESIKITNRRMSKNLEEGLDSLCNNKDLVIRPADKGGGIVVLDRSDYL